MKNQEVILEKSERNSLYNRDTYLRKYEEKNKFPGRYVENTRIVSQKFRRCMKKICTKFARKFEKKIQRI